MIFFIHLDFYIALIFIKYKISSQEILNTILSQYIKDWEYIP